MKKILWTAVFIFLIGIQAGYAHHLWVFEENGKYVVARGHMPERIDAYDPKCVTDVNAYDETGSAVLVQRKDEANRVVFNSGNKISMITVRCDWGFRVNTTQGKKLISRKDAEKQGLAVISAFFSTQFLKYVAGSSDACMQPVGLKLEIVPLKHPSKLVPGELLPVQVCFDGKPLAGAQVSSARETPPVKTDQNGMANVRLPEEGKGLFSVWHKIPVRDDPEKDYHKFMTFLMFQGE